VNSTKPIPEINEPEFEVEVLKSEKPVLVDFWAPWSQPCRRVGLVLDELAAECGGRVKLVKVNVDDNPDLGMWYGIQSIPTLLWFVKGDVSAKIVGTASKEAILARLQCLSGKNQPLQNDKQRKKQP
jgi:thioredoxin 1